MKRREFLEKTLMGCATSAAFASMLGKLSIAQAASLPRLAGDDYRALVCIFLWGGNDSFNMLIPNDVTHWNQYSQARGALAIPRTGANSVIGITPNTAPSDGGTYGFHPQMGAMRDLFAAGKAAVISNVGPLVHPITQAQYQNGSVPVPPQLFSHSDQQVLWQSPAANATVRRGWGGRLADMFHTMNTNQQLSMNISLDGENVFQAGDDVSPYFLGAWGVEEIGPIAPGDWNNARRNAFMALQQASMGHPFQRAFGDKVVRTRAVTSQLSTALESVPETSAPFNLFAQRWAEAGVNEVPYFGQQLRMVARMIKLQAQLGMTRQIFLVGLGGFDTHDDQLAAQNELLRDLSIGMKAFHDCMASPQINLANQVTQFTASDFGRTLSINGDGTDHGWGSHHLVVGGSVIGKNIYGAMPSLLADNNPQDAGWGQIIPSLSVDQYAATLARWYGLQDSDRSTVFPNIGNFATPNLGFMQAI